ncbi:hypothetical protein PKOR_13275 [Pontibacter korlensis]|uniref:DUF547 domain-containing protein n=1 Tax=Pontibacter korlensis TaxID=400092 RepID=A0A0E3ZJ11_9BACT|nr:hypothetical protein PKOR_13275 [Pontibacter korlensis]
MPCFFVLLLTEPAPAQEAKTDFYTLLSSLLQRHVQQGQVNYKSLQQDKNKLQQLVKQIANYNLKGAGEAEVKAFYLNAYNLLVLQQVLENYPLKSVMDVEGFFDKKKHLVAGQSLTLNELEKQKLMKPFQDARLHFALVCAAKSCPPLLNQAYTPDRVEKQLQEQTVRTLQSSEFIRVQPASKRVLVSEIFSWYKDDFLREAPSIAGYINRYRKTALPARYSLGYYNYDWKLNDVK